MSIVRNVILSLMGVSAAFAADVIELQHSIVDSDALTFATGDQTKFGTVVNGRTHQQTPLVTHKGYQYAAYYDDERQVAVGRRKLPDGVWNVIRFDDYNILSHDTHNTVVIGICEGDGTIHLAFDHHKSSLHYRVSELGVADHPDEVVWSADLFGPVTAYLGSVGPISDVTYPRFFNAPNGNLMFYYRYWTSGNGDGTIQEYNASTHTWTTGLGRFISRSIGDYTEGGETSNFRCPYLNGISYSGNRLHVSWIWRDLFTSTSAVNNHDVCYAYSDDDGRTWRNSAGAVIGVTGSESVIHLDSPGLIVGPVARGSRLINQNGHYAFPDGSIHIVLEHNLAGTSTQRFHHYWRNAAGTWSSSALGLDGGRPKLVGDTDGNLFLLHVDGDRFRIIKGTPNAGMTSWSWSQVYSRVNPSNGGEAAVDFSRWEKERVLSIYGQEEPSVILNYGSGTPIDGRPSALYVSDYQVSQLAARPAPSTGAEHVSKTTSLAWFGGLDTTSYRVYFGTDKAAVAAATTASPEYQGEQTSTIFQPAVVLDDLVDYYWRVDGLLPGGDVVTGLVWAFTTQSPYTVARAGGDQTVTDADTDGIEWISLNGHASSPGAGLLISDYIWMRGSTQIATGVNADVSLPMGTHLITLLVTDSNTITTNDSIMVTVEPYVGSNILAGWDVWNSATTPDASVLAPDISATSVTSTEQQVWRTTDERGASADGNWGTYAGPPAASMIVVDGENLTLPNATSGGTITFSVSNHGSSAIELNAFHFDAYAFRPNAARAYELSVLAGSDITAGVIYTSTDDEITHVGGANDNLAHDDIDHSLAGLADHTLGAGESVDFLLAFSSGVGDESGGHHLFLDNVAISFDGADPYPDNDGNSLPDWWELYYLGSTGQMANLDSDLDGLLNGDEFIAGTDPDDIHSSFVVHYFEEETAGGYTVKWDSYSDRTYNVMKGSVLTSNDWSSISGPLLGTGGEMSFTDLAPDGTNVFYKLEVAHP